MNNKTPVAVISSLLETDLYKFTMQQALLHQFPANQATYRFVCRNKPEYPLSTLKEDVERELDALCALRFSQDELDYLRGLRYIKSDYADFLSIFHLQRRFIRVWTEGETLCIEAKGPQVHVMPFEIYVLAIVNELYFRRLEGREQAWALGEERLAAKIAQLKEFEPVVATYPHPLEISDFGLRRRYAGDWHEHVVDTMRQALPQMFRGTSDVYLAKKYNLVPIGTMAHEYLQTYQGVGVQLRWFQKAALEGWVQEYRGDLGIALTDVVGMDAFMADFDLYFAKLFDGLRHDSGEPMEWGEKALAMYQRLRINPMTKRLVFSDGLKVPDIVRLYTAFAGRIQPSFGYGTNLTNDVGFTPLNIVMKLVECNGNPVAKLPDAAGKTLCDDQTFLRYLAQVFHRTI